MSAGQTGMSSLSAGQTGMSALWVRQECLTDLGCSIAHRCTISARIRGPVEETVLAVDQNGLNAPKRATPQPHRITALLEILDNISRESNSFTLQRVGQPLVMKPGSVVGFPDVHAVVKDVNHDLKD